MEPIEISGNYISASYVSATAMTRQEYNDIRGWSVPEDEDPTDNGVLLVDRAAEPNHPEYDGFIRWITLEVFMATHTSAEELSLGMAIDLAKQHDLKMDRSGWNGKGMWVIYNPGSAGQTFAMAEGSVYKKHGVDECEILPHFDMYTINAHGRRAMLPGWLASQTDLSARDWRVFK